MSETRSATSEPATALATAPDAGLPSVRSSTRLDTLTSAQAGHKLQDLCPPPETIRVSAAVKLPEIGRQNLTGASSSLFDARDETPLGARSAGSASPEPGAGVWPWGGDGDFGHAWQESGPLLPGLYEVRGAARGMRDACLGEVCRGDALAACCACSSLQLGRLQLMRQLPRRQRLACAPTIML